MDRTCIAGKSSSLVSAWNSLQDHLLTLQHYGNALQFSSLAQSHRKYWPNFQLIVFNMSYIIINWKTLSFYTGSRLDFLYPSPKNVIRLLIANLWKGLILVRDEEKSSINQQFSSNQELTREKGSRAQSEDPKFEGFLFLVADQLSPARRQERHAASFFIPRF